MNFRKVSNQNLFFIIIYFTISNLLLFPQSLFATDAAGTIFEKQKVALVLSGGGARGLAQIGVLKAFDEHGIIPDIIIATSMGAIIGSLYCAGYSPDSIQSLAKNTTWDELLKNTSTRKKRFVSQKNDPENFLFEIRFDYDFKPILPSSISFGQSFYDILTPLLAAAQYKAAMDFDKFKIPLRIVATDLVTGKKVVFSEGNLITAIRASCSVPFAYSPVNHNGMYLVDGGISSNIPVETAINAGATFTIVSDVTTPLWGKKDLENPVKLVDQIIAIGISRQKEVDKFKADILIAPELEGFSNTDFGNIDSLISLGYSQTVKHIESIKSKLLFKNAAMYPTKTVTDSGTILLTQTYPFSTISAQSVNITGQEIIDPGVIKNINITGNDHTSRRIIQTAAALVPGDTLKAQSLRNSITSVYSTGLFQNVNMEFDTSKTLKIFIEEKKYWRVRMGLRFDEFHLGEAYVQPAYENLFGLGICASTHIQYGLRREKYAIDLQGNQLFSSDIANLLQLQAYISKEKIFQRQVISSENDSVADYIKLAERSLRKSGYAAMLGTLLGKFIQLSGGFRNERYKVQQTDQSPFGDALGLKFSRSLPGLMLKLTIDTMDKFPFPTSGLRHKFYVITNLNKKGINASYLKLQTNVGKYFTVKKQHTFFPQIQYCWTNDTLPEIERLLLGGSMPEERYQDISVYNYIPFIGLKPRALSGDCMMLIHFDYRLSLKKNFYAHLVADWGLVWDANDFKYNKIISDFFNKAPLGMGIGLSYESVVGPIRLFYGQILSDISNYGIKSEGQFYFSAGYDF